MIDREIDIQTNDGVMNTFITHPEENGPHPLIIFLMDAPGKREELHAMARRLGTAGYYVMLPNLYYRRVREYFIEESTREEMYSHMDSLSNAMVCEDIQRLMDVAEGDPAASFDNRSADNKIGCVGYCMSGPFAFAAAAAFPKNIVASASFHGVRLFTDKPDSPHLDAQRISGEMYFGCAETDEHAPQQMIDDLENHLRGCDINSRVEWYPGTEHGFVFPTRKGKYHEGAAERHWERLLSMFRRNLST
jgi:carboxymethylenebutenolidase